MLVGQGLCSCRLRQSAGAEPPPYRNPVFAVYTHETGNCRGGPAWPPTIGGQLAASVAGAGPPPYRNHMVAVLYA